MSAAGEKPSAAFALEHLGLETLSQFVSVALDGIVVIDSDGRFVYANPAACDVLGYPLVDLVGREFRSCVPERLHQSMGEAFAASIQGVTGRYTSALLRPDGSEREIEYSNMRFEIDGETILAAIFEDVTDQRRQAREAAILTEISSAMTVNLSMDATVEALAASVVKATDAIVASVLIVDLEAETFRSAGLYPPDDAFKSVLTTPRPRPPSSLAVMALKTGKQQYRHNVRQYLLGIDDFKSVHEHIRNVEWDTQITTPMLYRNTPIGVLVTFYPEQWIVSDDDLTFLRTVADQAAVAVTNSQLYQEAQSKAALQERQRLSGELHDSVSQALYGIALGAKTSLKLLESNPAAAAEPLDYVLSLADAGLAEMRALIFDLRPESLETEGLIAALEKQAAFLRARHGIDVDVDFCSEPAIPLQTKEAIYHIAQEALHNTVRHARATRVRLCVIDEESGSLTVLLKDNGIGFDPERPEDDHRGLATMHENAARLGGTFTIESTPGQGTLARVDIPLR